MGRRALDGMAMCQLKIAMQHWVARRRLRRGVAWRGKDCCWRAWRSMAAQRCYAEVAMRRR
eukprot:7131533-Lingulodinium_polyedra.AAC.1